MCSIAIPSLLFIISRSLTNDRQFNQASQEEDVTMRTRSTADERNTNYDDLDLLEGIPDMYRLLDLVLEQSSTGLGMLQS